MQDTVAYTTRLNTEVMDHTQAVYRYLFPEPGLVRPIRLQLLLKPLAFIGVRSVVVGRIDGRWGFETDPEDKEATDNFLARIHRFRNAKDKTTALRAIRELLYDLHE